MKAHVNASSTSPFDSIKRLDDRGEWWSARDLAKVLGYADYRNFQSVIEKAKIACENSGHTVADHIVDITDMIGIGKGGKRSVQSYRLTRYACYLVIQNGDPSKEVIAHGQTYFAVQTRKQEILELGVGVDGIDPEDLLRLDIREQLRDHNKDLAAAAKEAGVETPIEYAIFQNHGYKGLYGGLDVRGIKEIKSLTTASDWLDHLKSEELAANLFRATQTQASLRKENIQGREEANQVHFKVGQVVRNTIRELGNEMPEDLETAPDLKEVRDKVKRLGAENERKLLE